MEEVATSCEEVQKEGNSKCMGGMNFTSIMRKSLRFQSITRKFSDCPWVQEVAKQYQKTNEGFGPTLDRIYQSAPEFKRLRKNSPDLSFGSFVKQASDIEGENAKDVERGVFDATSSSFGKKAGIDVDKAMVALEHVSESQLAPEDVPDVDADWRVDEMVNALEPEWCYRQFRWLSADSGCSNGGTKGKDGCFMFKAGHYISETHTVKSSTPQDLVEDGATISLVKASSPLKQRQAGGYLKSSTRTWGICLPKADPASALQKMNNYRATLLKGLAENETRSSLLSLIEDDEYAHSLVSSMLQETALDASSRTQFIGFILQIPALILWYAMYVINFAVFLPFYLLQIVVAGVSYPLMFLGELGKFVRFLLALPVCLVAGIFKIPFALVYGTASLVHWIGSKLWGMEHGENWDSDKSYYGSMCTLFRNGIHKPDVGFEGYMHKQNNSERVQD